MENYIKNYSKKIISALNNLPVKEIAKAIDVLQATYERDGKIYIFGNGGSLAIATHWYHPIIICGRPPEIVLTWSIFPTIGPGPPPWIMLIWSRFPTIGPERAVLTSGIIFVTGSQFRHIFNEYV